MPEAVDTPIVVMIGMVVFLLGRWYGRSEARRDVDPCSHTGHLWGTWGDAFRVEDIHVERGAFENSQHKVTRYRQCRQCGKCGKRESRNISRGREVESEAPHA